MSSQFRLFGAAVSALALILMMGGCAENASQAAPPAPQLPQGGRTLFPKYRLVGYSGVAGKGPGLGRAGVGNIDDRMIEMRDRAQAYASDGRTIMPVLEYIATTVQPCNKAPQCRTTSTDEQVQKHLDAVRKVNGILLLAIQPGRSDFVTEVKQYEKFLTQPDVGVALDPEWRMAPDQEPLKTFGSVTSDELNATSTYLADLTKQHNLPEKVMLYHMIRPDWVKQPEKLQPQQGIVHIVSVDGIGNKDLKTMTWQQIMQVKPQHVQPGFKLFFSEDTKGKGKLMEPNEVMALKPTPSYVLYE